MADKKDSQQYPEIRLRLTFGKVRIINNVSSWLGLKPTEYIAQLINEDIKKQPEKYRLSAKEDML